jgi:hypothetical protein
MTSAMAKKLMLWSSATPRSGGKPGGDAPGSGPPWRPLLLSPRQHTGRCPPGGQTRLTCPPAAAGTCRTSTRPGGRCSSAAMPHSSGCGWPYARWATYRTFSCSRASLDIPRAVPCGAVPHGPSRAQGSPPLVVDATGCTPQQTAADQVRQLGLGVAESDGQPGLGADEHAASEPSARSSRQRT